MQEQKFQVGARPGLSCGLSDWKASGSQPGTRPNSPQLDSISDEKLFNLCRRYGEQTLIWRRKFIGLLPEVNRRGLYEKKGFSSIFEFAKKLAGISEEQVRLTLNLEKKFQNKPILKAILENGSIGINKLNRISAIATLENEESLATQVRILPKSALETLIKDIRNSQINTAGVNANEIQNGLFKPNFDPKSVPGHSKLQLNQLTVNCAGGVGSKELQLFSEVQ